MNRAVNNGFRGCLCAMALGLVVGAGMMATETVASAQRSGGGGGGGSVDATAAGTVIKLSCPVKTYNGAQPKGTVTLGYAADGSAQSMDFSLSQINVPDGTVLPVQVVTGVYHTVVSYYTYTVLEYVTTSGTLVVKNKSVTLSLSTLNGDVVPPFSLTTVGTTDVHIYSPDSTIEILSGTVGKLRP